MATYRKLKSGNWQARVSKDGEEFSIGTFRTKKEAQIEAAAVEEKIYYGHTLNDRDRIFEDVANEWLFEHKKNSVKDSTFEQLEVIVRLHILPFFGNKRIMLIKRPEINRWLNKYAEKKDNDGNVKYSYGARLKYLSVLKSIFHYAVYDLEILEKDPTLKLKIPVKDKTVQINKEIKYYNLQELNQLLDFMENYKHQRFKEYRLYYVLIYLLSQTGLRISEALALRWTDIDGDMLTVERQTSRDKNNQLKLTSLKTTSSYRTIKLDEDLIKEVNRFKLEQNQVILKYKSFKRNPDGIIFQNYLGNYLTPSTVRESIQKYCKWADVEYKGTHVFRHTHAVLSLEAGASIFYVSKRLGHKDTKETTKTYLDITEKIEEDELNKFASYTKRKSKSAQNRHDSYSL
ncbi:tyrosine-type recombinase/integrase [Sediminibacillus halophilus]|uniref:Site-specific recombinase XerD n=1 Tax=Sediminibacillus halophilus TaxID=482461 RepID=A0A1G9QYT0_9BACI|nr:site-specific integrase [Sediminibacillus halophilus]SDM15747.1 Site-specific recombinase XerD [Sediminibacillus halophilus]